MILKSNAKSEIAACTIVAKNYLPMARVLADSWATFHPDCPFFVLFLDSPTGFFSPENEQFQSIFPSDLDIPNLNGFLFKYSVLEASTAIKPYLLSHLLQKYEFEKLLYLDPDILILDSLSGLTAYLDEANILLTPHLLDSMPNDGRRLTELDILKSGTYNLGFLGLKNGVESERLLSWWCDKLYHHCLSAVEQNLFVDQRWMDLAPSLFEGTKILREPGYNVAYWNLHERVVSVGDSITVNGDNPLYFLHFSGFDADQPWIVSKHQTRFGMSDIGDLASLYLRYRDLLLQKGWEEAKSWTYGLDYFRNGVKISRSARRYYWSLGTDVLHLGDPFCWLGGLREKRIEQSAGTKHLKGVNLVGHFQAETGVGEGARSNLRIIRAAGVPYVLNNYEDPLSANLEDAPGELADHAPYETNLLTINADGMPGYARVHEHGLRDHFNIGYWAWELPEFPAEWGSSFGFVDEVWTPSQFTRDAVATRSPVPVRVVPHAMDLNVKLNVLPDRSKFGLDSDTFLFLFFFDFASYLERKNPLGLIHAFRKAFGTRTDVQLVIKSAHGTEHTSALSRVQNACIGCNIRIMDCVLSREETQEMMMAADCYVSLHRSEGFGLTMAEAMLHAKPVIATGYSGNVDFMSDDDSFLVPYRLVTIKETCGPYKAGYHWADPDLGYAADMMRQVAMNREAAARIGLRARNKVQKLLSPSTIAEPVRKRLQELGLLQPVVPVIAHGNNI